MLNGLHEAVLSRGKQLRPGRHGHRCCCCACIAVISPPLLHKGLRLQNVYNKVVTL